MLIEAARDLYYRSPVELQNFVLVRRRSPIWLRAGIVFVHVPKVAGTSFNQALYGRFMGHIPASSIRRWASANVRALPSFAVTRNPWDRLVSAYRFVKQGGGSGGAITAGVWRPERYRCPEFQSFERFVVEWLSEHRIGPIEHHFRPQTSYLCDASGKLLVDHVGRVENLEPTFDFLRENLHEIRTLPDSNRSGDAVDYRSFYTPELVELVGSIYAQDVKTFGYAFED